MQGFCPNCNADLNEKENVIFTKESAIFKGHNVYCMCQQCGYVMIYNLDRQLVFSLDRFKDDEDIIAEIQELLSEASNEEVEVVPKNAVEEVQEAEEDVCTGECHKCSGCYPKEEPKQESNKLDSISAGDLLLIHKETKLASVISQDNLDKINIDDYDFFEINPVVIERVVSYKIQRM